MTEEQFKAKFAEFGPLYNACLRKDPGTGRPSVGFVQFMENGSAEKAIKTLNGTTEGNTAYQIVIYKPPEDVAFEHRTTHQAKIATWKKQSNFVKDLPTEINEAKVIELFKECGPIESVRLIYSSNTYFDEANTK